MKKAPQNEATIFSLLKSDQRFFFSFRGSTNHNEIHYVAQKYKDLALKEWRCLQQDCEYSCNKASAVPGKAFFFSFLVKTGV
jgi:hypothetical protein